jgi:hypothetical protein
VTSGERIDRVTELLSKEGSEEKLFYLSFAEPDKWLGAIVVKGFGFTSAWLKTHELKINPGGQVMGREIPSDKWPAECWWNRLLTKENVEEMAGPLKAIRVLGQHD